MSWQEELNRLDEELSAGRMDSDEHRRRRDELLAAASSNPVVHRVPHPSRPLSGDTVPALDDADVTQQVIMPPTRQAGPRWQATPPAPQIIKPLDPPPIQGSEIFNLSATGGPRSGRRWPRFVIAVVVLAIVAGAVWWFAFRPKDNTAAPTSTAEFSIDKLPSPAPDIPLSTSGVLTVDQAQISNLIVPDEASYLTQGGAQKIFYRSATAGNMTYAIYAVQTKDPATARALAGKMVDRGIRMSMQAATVPDLPAGVTVTKVFGPKSAIYEAVYSSDRMAIRLLMLQTGANNEHQLETATQHAVATTVKSVPVR